MPLETASTIDQLVVTNPAHTDATGAADGHLRLIKAALKGTFANLVGVVTATASDLNAAAGGAIAALQAGTIKTASAVLQGIASDLYVGGNLVASGSINAGTIYQQSYILVPHGTICMFNLSAAPTGWAACDGTNGTPDLRNHYVIAQGSGTGGFTAANGVGTSAAGSGVFQVTALLYCMKL